MSSSEGFIDEFTKIGGAKEIAKLLGAGALGAAAGGGGMYVHGEKKRKADLKQLADLFRQANMTENKMIAQRAFEAGRRS